MDGKLIESRYRRFLLIMVALMCLFTIAELVLEKHYKETLQLAPFGLCIAGFLVTLAVLLRPSRASIMVMRGFMALLVPGSVVGGLLHLKANLEVVTDMQPNTTFINALLTSLSGAAPLLAPGILALAGILAIGATLYFPGLVDATEADKSPSRSSQQRVPPAA